MRHIQSAFALGVLSHWHMGAPLYHYTWQVGPRLGISGSFDVRWKWCHIIRSWLRLISTSDHSVHPFRYLQSVWAMVCCLEGICVHPYNTVPQAKLTPDLGKYGSPVEWKWCYGVIVEAEATSDHFIHPYSEYTKCLSHLYNVSRAYGFCWLLCSLLLFFRIVAFWHGCVAALLIKSMKGPTPTHTPYAAHNQSTSTWCLFMLL